MDPGCGLFSASSNLEIWSAYAAWAADTYAVVVTADADLRNYRHICLDNRMLRVAVFRRHFQRGL
jgi:hypothetical protein